jgi:hypothetical protein
VTVAGLFTDFRRAKDSHELRFRKVVITHGNSYPHDPVDDCLLSLIVCGVFR